MYISGVYVCTDGIYNASIYRYANMTVHTTYTNDYTTYTIITSI